MFSRLSVTERDLLKMRAGKSRIANNNWQDIIFQRTKCKYPWALNAFFTYHVRHLRCAVQIVFGFGAYHGFNKLLEIHRDTIMIVRKRTHWHRARHHVFVVHMAKWPIAVNVIQYSHHSCRHCRYAVYPKCWPKMNDRKSRERKRNDANEIIMCARAHTLKRRRREREIIKKKWESIAVVPRCDRTTLKRPMAIYCRNLIKIYWISVINPKQLDGRRPKSKRSESRAHYYFVWRNIF